MLRPEGKGLPGSRAKALGQGGIGGSGSGKWPMCPNVAKMRSGQGVGSPDHWALEATSGSLDFTLAHGKLLQHNLMAAQLPCGEGLGVGAGVEARGQVATLLPRAGGGGEGGEGTDE